MIVLGVDPGSQRTGFGVVRQYAAGLELVASGVIRVQSLSGHPRRIGEIYRQLDQVISRYRPECLVLETVFLSRNVQSALKIGQVRGAILALAMNHDLEVCEFAPREVKAIVTGSGAASKQQVAFMVSKLLDKPEIEGPFDVTDAIAMALCRLLRGVGSCSPDHTGHRSKKNSWTDFVNAASDRIVRQA